MSRRHVAFAGLVAAALGFGATFVVVKDALAALPPYAFVGWRFLAAAVVLLAAGRPRTAAVWRDGVLAGGLLALGYVTQTVGLVTTTASNSGLITGLYVVLTPLLAAASSRRRPHPVTVGGAALAFAGLGLLSVGDGFAVRGGDLLTVVCAVAFAAHIVVLAELAPRHGVVAFTAVQIATVAGASLVLSAAVEGLPLPGGDVLWAVLLTGVGVSGGAFLLQVGGQRLVGPSRTALVLALEPVFATATAAVVLGERLAIRGWVGAAAIVSGIYLVLLLAPPEQPDLRAAEAISEAW